MTTSLQRLARCAFPRGSIAALMTALICGCGSGGGGSGEEAQRSGWDPCGPPNLVVWTVFGRCGEGGLVHYLPNSPWARPEANCLIVGGGRAALSTSMVNASLTDADQTLDGDLRSAGLLELSSTTTSAIAWVSSIRGTAQSGVVFPAGGWPGAWISAFPDALETGSTDAPSFAVITVNTYLDGRLADSSRVIDVPVAPDSGFHYVTFRAEQPFNAVELLIGTEKPSSTPVRLQLHEICGDGGVS